MKRSFYVRTAEGKFANYVEARLAYKTACSAFKTLSKHTLRSLKLVLRTRLI